MFRSSRSLVSICSLVFLLSGLCRSIEEDAYRHRRASDGSFLEQENAEGSWQSALEQAQKLVERMTLDEQNNITYGYRSKQCAGFTGTAERVGFSGLCLNDGPAGVRGTDLVNGYAAGISIAAGWNEDVAHERGLYMGAEFKAKGVHIALGPVVEPVGRVVLGGRNWEGFGPDPFLSGRLAARAVQGLQKSVIANIKHYLGYEQETDGVSQGPVPAISSDIDDQTTHELYLWPFQDAVRADVGSVMCSYNRINSTYSCQNDYTLNKLLKGELAFQGPVISDFTLAQKSGVPSAKGGLDMAMPTSHYWDDNKLARAVQRGQLSSARLADMARRILAAWFKFIGGPDSSFPPGGYGLSTDQLSHHRAVDARNPASRQNLLQQATEGHVLVKNIRNTLPLKKPNFISLYGYDAPVFKKNYPTSTDLSKWAYGTEPTTETLSQLLVGFASGRIPLAPQIAALGALTIGGGSGANSPSYILDSYSAIARQADIDNTFLLWDFESSDPAVNPATEACMVFINQFSQEGTDRKLLTDEMSDTLVKNVASKCPNTIVVIHNAGIRLVDAWINNSNISAVLYAHLPGQMSGQALVDILYGKVSPSGRLPYTVAKKPEDYGQLLKPSDPVSIDPQSRFTEGIYIDYRYFLKHDITPRFPFGFGLTYSSFSYSNPSAIWSSGSKSGKDLPALPPHPKARAPGGIKSLFDTLATVSIDLTNTGSSTASEVAQLYLQFPDEKKVRFLRGFAKEELSGGETKHITFELTRRDLSRWNVALQSWELHKGVYAFHIGPNVQDIALKASLSR